MSIVPLDNVPKRHWLLSLFLQKQDPLGPGEKRLPLLPSKLIEPDGLVRDSEARRWHLQSLTGAVFTRYGRMLWITMPFYLYWAFGTAQSQVHYYGMAALLHFQLLATLAGGSLVAMLFTLWLAFVTGLTLVSGTSSYTPYPEAVYLSGDGIAFGNKKKIISWDDILLVRTRELNYRGLRRSNVLELYVEVKPYRWTSPAGIIEKIQDLFKVDGLKRSSNFFDPTQKKVPENDYDCLCLRLPLELFGFDADCEKFIKALKDNIPPEAFQCTLQAEGETFDAASFTSLWLEELRSPGGGNSERLLKAGHSLQNGRYVLDSVIGYGGFSVVYSAHSTARESGSNATVAETGSNLTVAESGGSATVHESASSAKVAESGSNGAVTESSSNPAAAKLPGLAAGDRLAIKEVIINSGGTRASKEAILKQIVSEIEILKTLDHPNIVRCLDYFIDGGRIYIVMQAIDGRNLRDCVQLEGAMSQQAMTKVGLQCCSILSYLHTRSKPLMHRDFTPDNLIWDGHTVKLVDFNVAEEVNTSSSQTIVGKHCFLASEQWCGTFTPRGDLYQLGCTLYYLATGKDPEPLTQSDPAVLRPDLSERFSAIVRKLTERNQEDRYATAGETADQLQVLLDKSESLAATSTMPEAKP